MRLANKQLSKSQREEIGKVEIEILEKEILELKSRTREERMKAYRKLLVCMHAHAHEALCTPISPI